MATQTTTLSSGGQVVIPKSMRTAHRWKPGTEFIVEEHGDEIRLRPKQKREKLDWEKLIGCMNHNEKARLEDLVGCLNYKGPRKTINEMDEAVLPQALRHK